MSSTPPRQVSTRKIYMMPWLQDMCGCSLDVAEKEPIDDDNPLLKLDNVIITPHIGMYSKEAINAVSLICAENVAAVFQGGTLKFQIV